MKIKKLLKKMEDFTLNQWLLFILACVFVFIVISTIAAFATGKAVPGKYIPVEETETFSYEKRGKLDTEYASFNGIGRIRCATKDGVSIVVTPWLSYKAGDDQFFEELSRKAGTLKGIVQEYFQGETKAELQKKGEESVKQNLLESLNSELNLNKIGEIYFSEYIFLD